MELGLTRFLTQKERAGGGEGEAEQENPDARVLEADDDFPTRSGGRLPWKQRRYTFREWPLEGPLTTGHLIKRFSKFGGGRERCLAEWSRSRTITESALR